MLEDFFAQDQFVARHRAGLFGEHIDGLAEDLRVQGYARSTIRFTIPAVRRFGRWMDQRNLRAGDVSEQMIAEFCSEQGRQSWTRHGGGRALRALLARLRQLGIAPVPTQPEAGWVDRIVGEFAIFLRQERALSAATLANYCPIARAFMAEQHAIVSAPLARLCVADIHGFILRRLRSCHSKQVQRTLTALRSFLRFLYLREQIPVPLAEHVPKVVGWPLSTPPRWLANDAIERTLASCDRRSPVGQRDYAILMLLARLGLRAGEIVSMELDDIRWEVGEITVCGKGRQRKRFPLTRDVGQAVSAYLKDARPSCSSRRVFLRTRAPYRELAQSSTLVTIVRRALSRAGVAPPVKGAHVFRHSLATNMLQNGATLTEIGQILNHKSPNTTAIYAKVDICGLSALARPWPGDRA